MIIDLSQRQLKFLVFVNRQNDWHPSSFIEIVAEHYEAINEKPFDRPKFENLIHELRELTTEKVASLQIALNILENL